ncbi:hypothetical protein [Streptomyces sp. NPDC049585]|uniref:hypothetical protein n=1 Tax=Streptomyces sp. NPDC049585 TaxID=3155154 RepID=UPI00342AFEBF
MSHAVEAVDAAASALHQGTWTPADLELSLARDFLAHRDALDPRLLPAMPPSPSPQGWVTQHVLWLEDVAQLADAFLTGWRPWLADGHMVALLTAYATLARTATPLAARLAQDWATEWQAPPTQEQTTWWEDWHLPQEQRRELDALTDRLVMTGAVMVMALNHAGGAGR